VSLSPPRVLTLGPSTKTSRGGAARGGIPRRPAGELAPVSFGQEQIWLHGQLAPQMPLYTESLTIRRTAPLDTDVLVTSFREIVRRHDIWRTTFVWADDQLVQEVHPGMEPRLRVTDLRHLPQHEREASALQLALEDLGKPFNLSREPGVRALLVKLSESDQRLFLGLHHMVFDGVSIYRVLLSELAALCEAGEAGVNETRCGLDDLPLQYGDFAYWQRRTMGEVAWAPLIEYWCAQLAGAPPLIGLPTDHPRPSRQSFRGGLVRFQVAGDLAAGAKRAALEEHCTLFMLLLASFAVTLHRWSGQSEMLIGSVSGGRDHPELERLIGYFMRTLVLRMDLRGDPTFREILRRVREVLLDALCHDALPFQRLIQAVARERDLSCNPLFQVTLSIEPPKPPVGPQWDISELDAGVVASKFDLSVELEDRGDLIRGRAIYSRDLFEAATISELVGDWLLLIGRAVADPGQRLSQLVNSR